MGCKSGCLKDSRITCVESELKESFLTENFFRFVLVVRKIQKNLQTKFNINTYTVNCFFDYNVTIPSLCIIFGKLEFFEYILKNFEVSLIEIEKNLNNFQVSSLFFLCSKNFPEFLQFFLPLYMENCEKIVTISAFSVYSEDFYELKSVTEYTPVQMACNNGHMNIINIVFEFFKDKNFIPDELNINAINNVNGDNCALIACRQCNYSLIKFLHQKCKCDFSAINFQGENALQAACQGQKLHKSENLLCICKFLIEEIQVDLNYNYEKTLILCEDEMTLEYLKTKFPNN